MRRLSFVAALLAACVIGLDGQTSQFIGGLGPTNATLRGDVTVLGTLTPSSFREEFDYPCVKRTFADYTADTYVDGATNLAYCLGSRFIFEMRIDGTQTTPPFVVSGGTLDIDGDGTDNEGVDIVLGDFEGSTQGYATVGSMSYPKYVKWSVTIASVSGTDNAFFGWRQSNGQTFVDNMVLATYDTYGVYALNDAAGNLVIQTGDDTVDGTDEEDQVATWADAATHELEVRLANDGSFSFYIDGLQSTQTNATGAAAAGDIMIPFFSLLNAADADTEMNINWMEVGDVR